jgi:hypothetical protein
MNLPAMSSMLQERPVATREQLRLPSNSITVYGFAKRSREEVLKYFTKLSETSLTSLERATGCTSPTAPIKPQSEP